jgi:hypothetical protein
MYLINKPVISFVKDVFIDEKTDKAELPIMKNRI